jgi:hypothetical protein
MVISAELAAAGFTSSYGLHCCSACPPGWAWLSSPQLRRAGTLIEDAADGGVAAPDQPVTDSVPAHRTGALTIVM